MDNDDAKAVLLQIRRMVLDPYPLQPADTVDLRYAMAFGLIGGIATEAVQAVSQKRPARFVINARSNVDTVAIGVPNNPSQGGDV